MKILDINSDSFKYIFNGIYPMITISDEQYEKLKPGLQKKINDLTWNNTDDMGCKLAKYINEVKLNIRNT